MSLQHDGAYLVTVSWGEHRRAIRLTTRPTAGRPSDSSTKESKMTEKMTPSELFTQAFTAICEIDDEAALLRLGTAVSDQLKTVRKQQARRVLMTMKVGDRVRIVDDIRPAKFAGCEGVVRMMPTSARSNKVSVLLDGEIAPLRVPASALTLVELAT